MLILQNIEHTICYQLNEVVDGNMKFIVAISTCISFCIICAQGGMRKVVLKHGDQVSFIITYNEEVLGTTFKMFSLKKLPNWIARRCCFHRKFCQQPPPPKNKLDSPDLPLNLFLLSWQ